MFEEILNASFDENIPRHRQRDADEANDDAVYEATMASKFIDKISNNRASYAILVFDSYLYGFEKMYPNKDGGFSIPSEGIGTRMQWKIKAKDKTDAYAVVVGLSRAVCAFEKPYKTRNSAIRKETWTLVKAILKAWLRLR